MGNIALETLWDSQCDAEIDGENLNLTVNLSLPTKDMDLKQRFWNCIKAQKSKVSLGSTSTETLGLSNITDIW